MPVVFRRLSTCALSPSVPFHRTKATRPAPVALQFVPSIEDPAGHFAAAGVAAVDVVAAVSSLFFVHPVSARGAASPSASTIAVVFEPSLLAEPCSDNPLASSRGMFMAADGTAGV